MKQSNFSMHSKLNSIQKYTPLLKIRNTTLISAEISIKTSFKFDILKLIYRMVYLHRNYTAIFFYILGLTVNILYVLAHIPIVMLLIFKIVLPKLNSFIKLRYNDIKHISYISTTPYIVRSIKST